MQRILLGMTLLACVTAGQVWAQAPEPEPEQNLGLGKNPDLDLRVQESEKELEQLKSVTISVFVLGKVVVEKNKVSIWVKSAREANGAGLKKLVGTSLTVTGEKIQRLEQMGGKDVELRGRVTDDKDFEVLSYTERRTVTAAESAQVQGARGPVGRPRGAINAKGPGELPSASGIRTPIGALNDPKGAGAIKPNAGVIGSLQGRKKPMEPDVGADLNLPAVAAAAGAVR